MELPASAELFAPPTGTPPAQVLLLQLADHADSGLAVIEQAHGCTFANRWLTALVGGGTDSLVGGRWLDAFSAEDREHVSRAVEAVLDGRASTDRTMHVRTAPQGPRGAPARVRLSVSRASTPAPAAVISVVSDTESVDYERLLVLLKVLPCGVAVEGTDGGVLLVNDELCRLFDLDGAPADWVGRDGDDLARAISVHLQDGARYLDGNAELLRGRRAVTDELAAVDGRLFERDYLPVFDDGAYGGHVWMYWDFTERKVAERGRERRLKAEITAQQLGAHAQRERALEAELARRTLAEENEALAAIDALRAQLLATSSHELRTPLTAIISFIGLLTEMTERGDERFAYIEIIERNAQRLLGLVTDLLLLTRLGSGAEEFSPIELDLADIVRTSIEDSRMKVAVRSVTVHAELAETALVRAEPTRMSQVVDNLLSNAVKYSRADGTVTVQLSVEEDTVRLAFIDRGIGIPEAELGQLFGQFFRASTARSSGVAGTGLGLAIVKAIVEQHHGSIALSSREGLGTTVTVTLPRA